eukprot:Skav208004  [mRNA]  locus=scaffold1203:245696:252869:+ [translate_table: standard]
MNPAMLGEPTSTNQVLTWGQALLMVWFPISILPRCELEDPAVSRAKPEAEGNPAMAAKYMSEHMPRYVRGKAAFKELNQLGSNMDFYAVAVAGLAHRRAMTRSNSERLIAAKVPLTPKTQMEQKKLFNQWRAVLSFERTNPLQLEGEELTARVALVYQQAAFAARVATLVLPWPGDVIHGKKQDEATEVLRKAVQRFLPKEGRLRHEAVAVVPALDLTLRLLLAQRYELGESPLPASQLEAADDAYRSRAGCRVSLAATAI